MVEEEYVRGCYCKCRGVAGKAGRAIAPNAAVTQTPWEMTLTKTAWPGATMSEALSTLYCDICDTCSRPVEGKHVAGVSARRGQPATHTTRPTLLAEALELNKGAVVLDVGHIAGIDPE